MTHDQALARAHDILSLSKYANTLPQLQPANFREFASLVVDVLRYELTPAQREALTWLPDWVDPFKQLNDDFERIVALDPMMLYRPLTPMHAAFEASPAFVRYGHCATGTGKTTLGLKCLRDRLTGRDYLGRPIQAGHCAVVSVGLSSYAQTVFRRKCIDGDPHDILTPIFPEHGKWFSDYSARDSVIYIACRVCAEAGRPRDCSHRLEFRCFSEESGIKKILGSAYAEILLDEPVDEEWFVEAGQRVRRGGMSGRIDILGTAKWGVKQWEYRRLINLPPALNKLDPSDPNSPPYVQIFSISKKDSGLFTDAQISQMRLEMSESEFEAIVNGKMIAIVDNPVFNYNKLDAMAKLCRTPTYGSISALTMPTAEDPLRHPVPLETLEDKRNIVFTEESIGREGAATHTGLRIWESPQERTQYVISADVGAAQGAKTSDPSSATVWKLVTTSGKRVAIEEVAKFYGWLNPFLYGDELKKMAVWYNDAIIIPETTGIGEGLVLRLNELCYPNVFRDMRDPSMVQGAIMDARVGVSTNVRTKGLIIMAIIEMMRSDLLLVRDVETINEMRSYEETRTPSGMVGYEAASGQRDDRVMDTGLACYAIMGQGDLLVTFLHQLTPDMLEQPLTDAQHLLMQFNQDDHHGW